MSTQSQANDLPFGLQEAHREWNHATEDGKHLWPTQREAYCAGYWTMFEKTNNARDEAMRDLESRASTYRSGLLEWQNEAIRLAEENKRLREALERCYKDALEFLNDGDFKRDIEWDAGYIADALKEGGTDGT